MVSTIRIRRNTIRYCGFFRFNSKVCKTASEMTALELGKLWSHKGAT
jgi:hypothetical protein|tara:strand:- start:1404 stop:1544 length:141 start_codon:yes stop_codon:yes gene_type:complete